MIESRHILMCDNCGLSFEIEESALFVICPGCNVTITVSAERMPVEEVALVNLLVKFFLN